MITIKIDVPKLNMALLKSELISSGLVEFDAMPKRTMTKLDGDKEQVLFYDAEINCKDIDKEKVLEIISKHNPTMSDDDILREDQITRDSLNLVVDKVRDNLVKLENRVNEIEKELKK
jgi:hypothetical protein